MTNDKRDLARVFASEPMHDVEDAPSKLVDTLVTWLGAALELVHRPARPPDRDLPEGHALQISAELGLDQGRLYLQRHRRRELGVDDFCGFAGALERAVHDPLDAAIAQRLSHPSRLRPPECAEVKAGQVTVENPAGILDIGMTHQQHLGGRSHGVSLSIRSD